MNWKRGDIRGNLTTERRCEVDAANIAHGVEAVVGGGIGHRYTLSTLSILIMDRVAITLDLRYEANPRQCVYDNGDH